MLEKLNKKLHFFYLNHPIFVIFVSLSLTILISSGIIYVKQDDDMVNLLPDEIGSRKIFDEIQDEYGLTEYMYVAVGNKNKNILNKNDLNIIADLSNQFESLSIVDDVISITNLDKISLDPSDSSIVIDDLFKFPISSSLEI